MSAAFTVSWAEHRRKLDELCSERLEDIATSMLELEAKVDELESDLEAAREIIAELERDA